MCFLSFAADVIGTILQQLPKSIAKRISESSSNQDIFDESLNPYKDALKESGLGEALNFIEPTTKKKLESGK